MIIGYRFILEIKLPLQLPESIFGNMIYVRQDTFRFLKQLQNYVWNYENMFHNHQKAYYKTVANLGLKLWELCLKLWEYVL